MQQHEPSITEPRRENVLLNLACNIVVPGLILSRLSAPERLGPVGALLLGISFPLGYGVRDLVTRRRWNFFSIVGLLSVGLTGGFSWMKLDGFWFAVKDASVPALFGVAVVATVGTKRPLVRELILNGAVVNVARLEAGLDSRGTRSSFDLLLRRATWWIAGGFAGSAVLHFVLARLILTSPGGTPEFTAELGHMMWLTWPVVVLPTMVLTSIVLWRLLAGVRKLTGLELDDLLHGQKADPNERPRSAT